MIIISQNTNNSPHFTSGLTRKLRRNFYATEIDVVEIFNKHPDKNGIAGELPTSWIKKINNSNSISTKREAIQNIFKEFGTIVKLASTNIEEATQKLNQLLRKYHILNNKQCYSIKKIDTSEYVYTKNGYILKGKYGAENLFIKEFEDFSNLSPARYKMKTETDGKYVELARALQINHQIKDRHIMHTNWGDTQNGYMVSEYIEPLKKYKSKIEIKEIYENEKELIKDLYKKYGFTQDEIKNNKVKIGYEYENKFYSYPEEQIIYNYFSKVLGKIKLVHNDIMYNDNNYIITKDKAGNALLKLIDFGRIKKNNY